MQSKEATQKILREMCQEIIDQGRITIRIGTRESATLIDAAKYLGAWTTTEGQS